MEELRKWIAKRIVALEREAEDLDTLVDNEFADLSSVAVRRAIHELRGVLRYLDAE